MQVVAYLHLSSDVLTPLLATHCGNRKLMAYAKLVRCFIYIAKPASPCRHTSQDIYVYCACHCSSCYLSTCSPSLILRRHVCWAPDSNPIVAPPPRQGTPSILTLILTQKVTCKEFILFDLWLCSDSIGCVRGVI